MQTSEKWEDLNNLIGSNYKIEGKILDWYCHTSLYFTRKSKNRSRNQDKSKDSTNIQMKNPNSEDKATGTNRIPWILENGQIKKSKKTIQEDFPIKTASL